MLELVAAFERVSGVSLPLDRCERRPGDVAQCWADPTRAFEELGWVAKRDLDTMMRDAWRWQQANPMGYEETARPVPASRVAAKEQGVG
ncbi:GDP-mannose 4,6-dehydratase [Pseudomonas japonica]|uniref:GDP-mannose 4,6-dehydratase n=2 Tax=Pseudomonas japonica TaxID=256466 RepID=UPI00280A81E4|nr:GDP-mannose 4,6-dehydratase [Pseudomonas japonica]